MNQEQTEPTTEPTKPKPDLSFLRKAFFRAIVDDGRKRRLQQAATQSSTLKEWLTDPRMARFMGSSFSLKASVLAVVVGGGNLSAVARAHGVTRQAACQMAKRARLAFSEPIVN